MRPFPDRWPPWSLLVLTVFASLLVAAPSLQAESCSCTAPDGSCSASMTCTDGGIPTCSNGGDCSAQCSGGDSGPGEPFENNARYSPADSLRAGAISGEERRISLGVRSATGSELSAILSERLGVKIEIVPRGEVLVALDVKDYPAQDLLAHLQTVGALGMIVPGSDRGPSAELAQRLNVSALDSTPEELAVLLARLLDQPVEFQPAEPGRALTLDVKDASAYEVLRVLERFGTVVTPGLEAPADR